MIVSFIIIIQGSLSYESWSEMVTNTIGTNESLKEELVCMLVSYDLNEAAKWADKFNMEMHKRPHCIRDMQHVEQW